MSANRGGQVDEDVELLQLAGARDGEQPLHSPFALVATRAKTGLPPLHWRSQCSLGHVVRGLDPLLMGEGEEMLMVQRPRLREIPHRLIGPTDIVIRQREEFLRDRLRLAEPLVPTERRAPGLRAAAIAVPQPAQATGE